MASPGYLDTRARLIDLSPHKARWLERVPDAVPETPGEIQREQAPELRQRWFAANGLDQVQAITAKGKEVDEAPDRLKASAL